MPKLPVLSGREMIRALERLGFRQSRQRGSHVTLRRESKVCVVPLHKELALGTLSAPADARAACECLKASFSKRAIEAGHMIAPDTGCQIGAQSPNFQAIISEYPTQGNLDYSSAGCNILGCSRFSMIITRFPQPNICE